MDALQPGHFWKTPFFWEPGCAEPPSKAALAFEPIADHWLHDAVAQVMAASFDESDRYAVRESGARTAATELLAIAPEYFELRPNLWRVARNAEGLEVGFVLPVLLRGEKAGKYGKPEGTIFYMGVLPQFRGNGDSRELLAEATRIFIEAGCWRIFCDTGSMNQPMINAFRVAGYMERSPRQRPLK